MGSRTDFANESPCWTLIWDQALPVLTVLKRNTGIMKEGGISTSATFNSVSTCIISPRQWPCVSEPPISISSALKSKIFRCTYTWPSGGSISSSPVSISCSLKEAADRTLIWTAFLWWHWRDLLPHDGGWLDFTWKSVQIHPRGCVIGGLLLNERLQIADYTPPARCASLW